ncbi:putative enterotoxin [Ophiocordyceps australis]|uniref:Putative enterotoxin n=1 Tax=Ophiocordyceps australis TaxID=1399860 RepID=A0A2C5Y9R5_9HYPO|nr:putative enterotoxin [Ophiocordyceps australis]
MRDPQVAVTAGQMLPLENDGSALYLYKIHATPNFISLDESLFGSMPLDMSMEYDALGGIYWDQVLGWLQIPKGVTGGSIGEILKNPEKTFISNPDYNKRFDLYSASPGQPQLNIEDEDWAHGMTAYDRALSFMNRPEVKFSVGWMGNFPLVEGPNDHKLAAKRDRGARDAQMMAEHAESYASKAEAALKSAERVKNPQTALAEANKAHEAAETAVQYTRMVFNLCQEYITIEKKVYDAALSFMKRARTAADKSSKIANTKAAKVYRKEAEQLAKRKDLESKTLAKEYVRFIGTLKRQVEAKLEVKLQVKERIAAYGSYFVSSNSLKSGADLFWGKGRENRFTAFARENAFLGGQIQSLMDSVETLSSEYDKAHKALDKAGIQIDANEATAVDVPEVQTHKDDVMDAAKMDPSVLQNWVSIQEKTQQEIKKAHETISETDSIKVAHAAADKARRALTEITGAVRTLAHFMNADSNLPTEAFESMQRHMAESRIKTAQIIAREARKTLDDFIDTSVATSSKAENGAEANKEASELAHVSQEFGTFALQSANEMQGKTKAKDLINQALEAAKKDSQSPELDNAANEIGLIRLKSRETIQDALNKELEVLGFEIEIMEPNVSPLNVGTMIMEEEAFMAKTVDETLSNEDRQSQKQKLRDLQEIETEIKQEARRQQVLEETRTKMRDSWNSQEAVREQEAAKEIADGGHTMISNIGSALSSFLPIIPAVRMAKSALRGIKKAAGSRVPPASARPARLNKSKEFSQQLKETLHVAPEPIAGPSNPSPAVKSPKQVTRVLDRVKQSFRKQKTNYELLQDLEEIIVPSGEPGVAVPPVRSRQNSKASTSRSSSKKKEGPLPASR